MPRKTLVPQFDEKMIFTYDPKFGVLIGGEVMDEKRISNLQQEIKFIEESDWWLIVSNTLPKKAQEVAFVTSTKFDDLKTAKAFLRIVYLIRELNAMVRAWKPREVKTKLLGGPVQY